MRTFFITFLAILTNVIAADYIGTDDKSSSMNLRGSPPFTKNFRNYVKAQYRSDESSHANVTPSLDVAVEDAHELFDTTKNAAEAKREDNEASPFEEYEFAQTNGEDNRSSALVENQKFLEGTEEASISSTYCRDWGACYSFSPFFCCSGICNLIGNGTPLGECQPSSAIAEEEEISNNEDTQFDVAGDQEVSEDSEKSSVRSNYYCFGGGSRCTVMFSHQCCSGKCISDGSPYWGSCAP